MKDTILSFIKQNKLILSVSFLFLGSITYFLFAIHVLPLKISRDDSKQTLGDTSSYIKSNTTTTKLNKIPSPKIEPTEKPVKKDTYIQTKTTYPTSTPKPTVTPTPTLTPIVTPTPTVTQTPTPTIAPTGTQPSATPSPTSTPTPTATPSYTPTPTGSITPTQ